ncbi:MAG: RNA polymerase-associated protein RapA [Gammaproteobacteria bacterium]|nr:RNA polymerase-associated protein RapA [Gammaproteobacteria bacterium]
MKNFIPGQRWISDAELSMGLGTILTVEHRTVTLHFLATGEMRTYAKQTAPLTRVAFSKGDKITSHLGDSIIIDTVIEEAGLLSYLGTDAEGHDLLITEAELDNFTRLNRPGERLFTGQVDQDKWFELRYKTLQKQNALSHSDLQGLIGARTSLIPHQLYIAHEVANRYAPRVLLADEVGLGKTIEAGLILHHQLLTERAQRVLIVVPETLMHQWLVEMIRRFNLFFSIYDESRCEAIEESAGLDNPFQAEQLVLCSLDFFNEHAHRFEQALAGNWDLLVVDEAHHLQWNTEGSSNEYDMVAQLAAVTRGVLLLTATPEQLGKASHFAQLRLLDPDRFHDFDSFVAEEKSYEPIAHVMELLLAGKPLDKQALALLKQNLSADDQGLLDDLQSDSHRQQIIEQLIDQHGTGRILFRNTRAAVKGFPQRRMTAYPLPLPEAYARCLQGLPQDLGAQPQLALCPEIVYQAQQTKTSPHWTEIDPRINWLYDKLLALHPEKVLLIAANASTALDIAHILTTRKGIQAAVFHEGLSIIERDRAAAFFADKDKGCQLLICSEIGSEGRNFQFAHHLVLFDLPLNPDLLEQRIGRLDRIGQAHTIDIHLPCLQDSAQQFMADWYDQGLSAFEHTCPTGHTVFMQLKDELIDAIMQPTSTRDTQRALIERTATLNSELNQAMHQGRDQLLEYNSCRQPYAGELHQRCLDADTASDIYSYMDAAFDCFNIDFEEHRKHSYIIHPSEHMMSSFPGLPDDGMTITFKRDIALEFEDIHYLTWEHPMVINTMDMVMSNELGNTALTAVNYRGAKPGTLLLECLFVLETASDNALQSSRYLPTSSIRVLLDEHGNDHSQQLSHDAIYQQQTIVDLETARKVIQAKLAELKTLISDCEQRAEQQCPQILKTAHAQSRQTLEGEINRLRALQQVNPNVRNDEITFFEEQWKLLDLVIEATEPRLDAVRVIIAT